ncbi:hypothetical protein GCM10010191_65290 [Actinomadura vinacea]|uniref:Transposase n=1 Tax=Actinomadura vinacea TaxID=115336 RepID=A0ABN3JV60_9ACTN
MTASSSAPGPPGGRSGPARDITQNLTSWLRVLLHCFRSIWDDFGERFNKQFNGKLEGMKSVAHNDDRPEKSGRQERDDGPAVEACGLRMRYGTADVPRGSGASVAARRENAVQRTV